MSEDELAYKASYTSNVMNDLNGMKRTTRSKLIEMKVDEKKRKEKKNTIVHISKPIQQFVVEKMFYDWIRTRRGISTKSAAGYKEPAPIYAM